MGRGSLLVAGLLVGEALRALSRHKVRSALTALSVTIGITAVVWVVAIGEGGAARAEEQLQKLGDNLVWVEAGSRSVSGVRTGTHGTTSLTLDDAQAIFDEVPFVKSLSPQVDATILMISDRGNWTTRARGVAPPYLEIRRWELAGGAAFTERDVENAANVCVIGQTVREQLFGADDAVGQDVRIGVHLFHVVGVLAPKGQSATGQDQDDTVMLPHTTALKKLRGRGSPWVDDIMCSAVSPLAVKAAAAQITSLLRERHRVAEGGEDDFNIRRPEELIKAQIEASRTFALLLVTIASISLVVGGVGITNMMLASVAERTTEIGLRLAIGATEQAVQVQFLVEAALLSVLGGLAGVAFSVAGSFALERVLGWSLSISPEAVLLALAFSIGVGVLFGFYPARKAARMDPIAALRRD